jgi:[acyl-carrier-protein] S-malonyltransferase
LNALDFKELRFPLVNNARAAVIRTGPDARLGLIDQICAPVLWEQSIRRLRAEGADCFIEVGPGRVLTGLMRQIEAGLQAVNVEDSKSLEKTLAVFAPGAPGAAGPGSAEGAA